MGLKGLAKVTWKQMWFDLIPAGTPPEKINLKPSAVLVNLWKDLTSKQIVQIFSTCPYQPPCYSCSSRGLRHIIVLFGMGTSYGSGIRYRTRLPPGKGMVYLFLQFPFLPCLKWGWFQISPGKTQTNKIASVPVLHSS